MMRFSLSLLALAALCHLSPQAIGEVRTWTDNTGRFSTQAEVKDYTGGQVHLNRDGKTVIIPFEKLSKDDQGYITKRMEARRELKRLRPWTFADGKKQLLAFTRLEAGALKFRKRDGGGCVENQDC